MEFVKKYSMEDQFMLWIHQDDLQTFRKVSNLRMDYQDKTAGILTGVTSSPEIFSDLDRVFTRGKQIRVFNSSTEEYDPGVFIRGNGAYREGLALMPSKDALYAFEYLGRNIIRNPLSVVVIPLLPVPGAYSVFERARGTYIHPMVQKGNDSRSRRFMMASRISKSRDDLG